MSEVNQNLREELDLLKIGQNNLMSSMEDIKKLISTNNEATVSFLKEVQSLREENSKLTGELLKMGEHRMRDLQQQRAKHVEIIGVPFQESEDLISLMHRLAKHLQLNLAPSAIDEIFRTKSKRKIICKLVCYKDKAILMKNCKTLKPTTKDIGINNPSNQKIYLHDSLVPELAEIFWIAKKLQKDGKIDRVWPRGGYIYARRGDHSPLRIDSKTQANELAARFGDPLLTISPPKKQRNQTTKSTTTPTENMEISLQNNSNDDIILDEQDDALSWSQRMDEFTEQKKKKRKLRR